MAKNNNLKDFVTGIASAIREKKGTTELINPQDFENEIRTIQTGSDPAGGKSLAAQIIDRSVTDVTAGDLKGATKIGNYAFCNCSGLTSITIPSTVTVIENDAFRNCTKLTSVTIPNGVTSIEQSAFHECNRLPSIMIPNSVTSIGSLAFANCYKLASVYITDLAKWCAVSFANKYANPLSYAHNLYLNGTLITELIIPNAVTLINSYAFCGCSSLTSIMIPNSVTSIGDGAFRECNRLPSIAIPDSVTSIGKLAFYGCSSLTSITIPDSVTNIEQNLFYECSSLTSITIPGSVRRIEVAAFYNCSTNTELGGTYTILATTPPTIQSNTFGNAKINKIIVPKGTLAAYKSATNWVALANKIEEATE